jgi:hypothetical protein
VIEYHLIFDLNGVLVATWEAPTRLRLVILKLGLKDFLSSGASKFIVYIWSFAMRRNFNKKLETIKERTGVHLDSSRIVDQTLCLQNEHFFLEKSEKHVLHNNLNTFFNVFLV